MALAWRKFLRTSAGGQITGSLRAPAGTRGPNSNRVSASWRATAPRHLVQQDPVAHPAGADHEMQIPARDHDVLDHHRPRQHDVRALGLEPADLPARSR